jgi:5-formyltetrahydrofolate cyclo-ligase
METGCSSKKQTRNEDKTVVWSGHLVNDYYKLTLIISFSMLAVINKTLGRKSMEEIQKTKSDIRIKVDQMISGLSESELAEKTGLIEERLFEFANFLEANIVLLYINSNCEVNTRNIIQKCFDYNKIIVLPSFNVENKKMTLLKVGNIDDDLNIGPRGLLEPNQNLCKVVPIDVVDLSIIPGIAFDEKGARLGDGDGYYDRLIPQLSITTRKVALTTEGQIFQQIPMESHDKHVDIIITEKRTIYKI